MCRAAGEAETDSLREDLHGRIVEDDVLMAMMSFPFQSEMSLFCLSAGPDSVWLVTGAEKAERWLLCVCRRAGH